MSQSSSTIKSASMPQAKIVIIKRRLNQGFGFTLRHFIAYPPESDPKEISESQVKAMETVFIKDVHPNGPAYYANLKTGDRLLMVNNIPIAGVAYSTIVSMIKKTPSELKLLVVPKECDVLQMHYNSIAHTSQSNVIVNTTSCPTIKPFKESGNYSEALIPSPTWKAFQKSFRDSADNSLSISGNVLNSTNASGEYHPPRSDLCSVPPSNQIKLVPQQQQGIAATMYTSNVLMDNSSLMTRLHESIKQKEEFLKSPISNVNSLQQVHVENCSTRAHQVFPHASNCTSPQLSVFSLTTKTSQDSVIGANHITEPPVRMLVDPSFSSTGAMVNNNGYTTRNAGSLNQALQQTIMHNNNNIGALNNSSTIPNVKTGGVILYDKNKEDLKFTENMQHTGVTNKVFERKLLSHLNINFDPFKPLSINTNAVDDIAVLSNDVILMNEPAILFEPLQQNSLPHMRMQQRNIPEQRQKIQANEAIPSKVVTSSSTSLTTPTWSNTSQISVDKQNFNRSQLDRTISSSPIKQHLDKNNSTVLASNNKILNNLSTIERKTTLFAEAADKDHHANSNNDQAVDAAPIKADNPKLTVVPSERMNNKYNSNSTDNYVSKTNSSSVIIRRFKTSESVNARKSVRRISYLRATNQENDFTCCKNNQPPTITDISKDNTSVHVEVEDNTGGVDDIIAHRYSCCDHQPPVCTEDDSKLKNSYKIKRSSCGNELSGSGNFEVACGLEINDNNSSHKFQTTDSDIFEAEVDIKSSCINGKRLTEYRSWRQVKIQIKGDILKIYASRNVKSDSNIIELNIKNFNVLDESLDKKKYVFRMLSKQSPLATLANELSLEDPQEKVIIPFVESGKISSNLHQQQPHTDIMFRTRSYTEMKRILGLLQWKNSLVHNTNDVLGRQTAEPQKKAATTSIPTVTICDENVRQQQDAEQHSIEILTSIPTSRNELEASSPISPILKSRKSVQKNLPKPLGSPKAKNWKDLLFRRGGGSTSCSTRADTSHTNETSCTRNFGTIGVPLKTCPMSTTNQYVPMLVDVCTNIVETKGLGVVGIYRIPGNKAAISELSDQVNMQDFSWDTCLTDVRWVDVNVVSGLLKLFIRSLPDALLPSSFYENFIEADKKQGYERLTELKHLLKSLPRHSYETMKHIFRHLNHVSKNCHVNLMEPKNLAIIFGPSIIRTPNDTLDIAVKDMKYQCRIVELLLTQYDYFFENGDLPDLKKVPGNNLATTSSIASCESTVMQQQDSHTNMLLHNISKIERLVERDSTSSVRTSRFIPQLRKRAQNKRNSDTYSGDSALSLDYTKSPCVTTTSSSSCSSTTPNPVKHLKNKERSFLNHGIRSHHRKTSLDEKDSASCSSIIKGPRSSIDMSVLLTDDESSHSRNSDSGSMSLGIITDTLNSKLSKLRSDLVDQKVMPHFTKNRRHTLDQPLNLQSEHIPYADESPERHFQFCTLDNANKINKNVMLSNSSTSVPLVSTHLENVKPEVRGAFTNNKEGIYKLQYSATAPINISISESLATKTVPVSSTVTTINDVKSKYVKMGKSDVQSTALRPPSSVYNFSASDSEGSTTSDQKDVLVVTAPAIVEKFNKRRNYRLFRSASFNCRHYSTRSAGSGSLVATCSPCTNLTKDEKTDMNLTKKRQIQNKQHRSIKRRHTVGGPHDYSADECVIVSNCNRYCKCRSSNLNASTTTTMVIKRIPLSVTNINVTNNRTNSTFQHNNNGHTSNNIRNGTPTISSSSSGSDPNADIISMPGDHLLEVDIRIKNISRNRFQS